GALATGALAKVAIVIRLRRVGGIANAASVTARQPDPDVRNNSADVSTKVVGPRARPRPKSRIVPQLALRPAIGPPGFVTSAIGSHFPAHAGVLLTWDRGLGRVEVRANKAGSFRVSVLVFYHDFLGRRELVATPLRKHKFSTARARFLVVPGAL